ncbi:MAG TPA: hypothetical protein V6C65_26225 [Allocoleopsis sp.]
MNAQQARKQAEKFQQLIHQGEQEFLMGIIKNKSSNGETSVVASGLYSPFVLQELRDLGYTVQETDNQDTIVSW